MFEHKPLQSLPSGTSADILQMLDAQRWSLRWRQFVGTESSINCWKNSRDAEQIALRHTGELVKEAAERNNGGCSLHCLLRGPDKKSSEDRCPPNTTGAYAVFKDSPLPTKTPYGSVAPETDAAHKARICAHVLHPSPEETGGSNNQAHHTVLLIISPEQWAIICNISKACFTNID